MRHVPELVIEGFLDTMERTGGVVESESSASELDEEPWCARKDGRGGASGASASMPSDPAEMAETDETDVGRPARCRRRPCVEDEGERGDVGVVGLRDMSALIRVERWDHGRLGNGLVGG